MTSLATQHTILAVVVGSRAYGLAGPYSDHDRRGVFVAPTELFFHLDKPPADWTGPAAGQYSWEVERFCTLALQAHPTVLECLWTPLIEHLTDDGSRLLTARTAFLSRRVADSYGRYADDQLRKLDAHLARTGEVRGKQAMHLLRLLLAGIHVLKTGDILVDVSRHRDVLLAVKYGDIPIDKVRVWADRLVTGLASAAERSTLPDEPDRATVDELLVRLRRRHLG